MNTINTLLIDDDFNDAAMFEKMLAGHPSSGLHFRVYHEPGLEQAIYRLSTEPMDVILLDLYLPESKGLATFKRIYAQFPETPVIILSGFNDDALAFEAVKNGAQDYLFKRDIQPDALVRTIRFAMERQKLKRELDEARIRLEKTALIDPVTELFNRRGIQEILSHEVQRAQRRHSNLLVLLTGLDDFKRINSTLGHSVGDLVLKEAGAKLKAALRATDYVARVGGDEFLVLLPDTRLGEGMSVAEKVRLAISTTTISLSSKENIKVTASLGLVNVGELRGGTPSIDELLAKTHVVLGKSKQAGRNRVSYDDLEDASGSEDHSVMFSEVLRGLQNGDSFYAVMQPIFRLQDKAEVAYEILVRSTLKGFEMPDDFFRASLEANILTAVDRHCFKTCSSSAASLPAYIRRHINLFPSTLISVPIKQLLQSLSDHGNRYCVEISEQQIIGDPSYLKEPVQQLRDAGVLIALDDLGFGRSCLESLILLEPDIIKIDKKCVTGITEEHVNMRSLKRLLSIAESVGAEVIAEGVETKADLAMLMDLGVSCAQGYFLGKPAMVPAGSWTP